MSAAVVVLMYKFILKKKLDRFHEVKNKKTILCTNTQTINENNWSALGKQFGISESLIIIVCNEYGTPLVVHCFESHWIIKKKKWK